MKLLAPLCVALLLLACNEGPYAGYTQRTGNLTSFALPYILECGGHPKTTNGLPAIQTSWKYKADKNGVQIYAEGDHFTAIQEFLTKAFGEPDPTQGSKVAGGPEGGRPWTSFAFYSVRDIGVMIDYFGNDKQSGLIICRPQ